MVGLRLGLGLSLMLRLRLRLRLRVRAWDGRQSDSQRVLLVVLLGSW